ncbi:MAG: type II secretion system protein [Phycisphaerales bacterium]|nr:type II secretion system protein [Phycisphaerales bacterium]
MHTSRQSDRYHQRAMTLVEMVVVLGCLAVLVPLIVAATGSSVRPNRERMCAYRLGQLGSAMLLYTIENDGYLPGSPGTSGAPAIRDYPNVLGDEVDIPIPVTQTWDWCAPLAGYLDVDLSPNRATRFEQFRAGKFWCPSNNFTSNPYFEGAIGPFGPWKALRMQSYDSVRNFMLYSVDAPAPVVSEALWGFNIGGTVEVRRGYYPRIGELGTVQDKVFVADGSRFITFDGSIDHEIELNVASGGAYSDGGPTLSTTYLRSYFLDSPAKDYAYRHLHGDEYGINAVHFDGHVNWMSESTSRHPRWWYPTGTIVPWGEMNAPTRLPLLGEIMQEPDFSYHVP